MNTKRNEPAMYPAQWDGMRQVDLADSALLDAVRCAARGVVACTINEKTHAPDVRCHWGRSSFLNDLYFGLHGGLYIGDEMQHAVFKDELRKLAATRGKGGAGKCPAPLEHRRDGGEDELQ